MNRPYTKFVLTLLISILLIGCTMKDSVEERKLKKIISLKEQYANKEVHITLSNNDAGVIPLTSKYAYVDKKQSDFAFEVKDAEAFTLSINEAIFVPTTSMPEDPYPEMVEIESRFKRGFVHYSLIWEFKEVSDIR